MNEHRNDAGYPLLWGDNRGNFHSSSSDDHSVNKPLPWIVLGCILASLALMGVIMMPMIIDAKVKAGSAKCEAVADLARGDAAVAKDWVDQQAAKMKAGVE